MVGGLIEANLRQHPERRSLLRPAVVELVAVDAGVSVRIALSPRQVTVSNGSSRPDRPRVRVLADSDGLLFLSSAPLRFGLPDPMSSDGRAVLAKVLRRQIRISGLIAHPLTVARFARLLSVA
ncbi:MAG TPA: hypothetical protein VI411_01190, partial [Actinomycetota bacterium]